MTECWDSGDADRYAELFREDAVYVGYDGVRQEGRAGIVRTHELLFGGVLRGSRLVGHVEDIQPLGPDVAVLRGVGTVVLRWQRRPARGRLSRQTLVAQRYQGAWRFVAFHNTRVRPPGRLVQWLARRG